MKYTYSGGRKTGKYQLRNIFLDNDKSTVCFCGGIPPVYVAMMTPDYKWDWYWENLDGKLVHDTYQDVKPQQGEEWRLQHGYQTDQWELLFLNQSLLYLSKKQKRVLHQINVHKKLKI